LLQPKQTLFIAFVILLVLKKTKKKQQQILDKKKNPYSSQIKNQNQTTMAQRKLTTEFQRLRSEYKSRNGGSSKRRSSSFNSSAGNQLLSGDVSSSAWEQVCLMCILVFFVFLQ
jgi:hypothetical protein